METFEQSKALRAQRRHHVTIRALKIGGLSALVGGLFFFLTGGMENPLWSCGVAVAIGGAAAASMHLSWD